jgi:hypothetical protein
MSRDYAKRYRNRSALKAAKPPKAKRSGVLKDGPGFGACGFTILPASTDTGTNLNRKTSAQGTKASGQTWTLDVTLTIS